MQPLSPRMHLSLMQGREREGGELRRREESTGGDRCRSAMASVPPRPSLLPRVGLPLFPCRSRSRGGEGRGLDPASTNDGGGSQFDSYEGRINNGEPQIDACIVESAVAKVDSRHRRSLNRPRSVRQRRMGPPRRAHSAVPSSPPAPAAPRPPPSRGRERATPTKGEGDGAVATSDREDGPVQAEDGGERAVLLLDGGEGRAGRPHGSLVEE